MVFTDLHKLVSFSKQLSILYLEDDPLAAEAALGLFKNFFNRIDWVKNGESGLHRYKKNHYDLIITDLEMPRMDGIAFCKAVLKQHSLTPIIVVSAHHDSHHYRQALQMGIHGYLSKPINIESLTDSLQNVIEKIYYLHEYRRQQNELEKLLDRTLRKADKQHLELQYKNYHDGLTGITNRNKLEQDLQHISDSEFLLLDIDGFSHINTIYGTKVGDMLLQAYTKELERFAVENFYTLYRVGGDHFAMIRYTSSGPQAQSVARQIVEHFTENTILVKKTDPPMELNISVTIGIAKGYGGHTLMEKAIEALKFAQNNRKPITVYEEELQLEKKYEKAFNAVDIVKSALQHNGLVPYFQAIDKGPEGIAYECLARVKKDGELLTPGMFMSDIFHTSLYAKLTETIIEQAFAYFRDKDNDFSINLSYKDIDNPHFVDYLKERALHYRVSDRLIIEIIECEYLNSFDLVRDFMQKMRRLGIKFAIDDFGSGYSNFTYLLRLKPDYLKIDGSLIRNMDKDAESYAIVKAIDSFAKDLKMKTIAEFIHSRSVYECAKQLGIDAFQGYYIGKPEPEIRR